MAIPLKDLLSGAVNRAHIAKGVKTARLISLANSHLATLLPRGHEQDARAIALNSNKILIVACRSGSAAHFLAKREPEILDYLKQELPDSEVSRLQTKVAAGFPEPNIMVE